MPSHVWICKVNCIISGPSWIHDETVLGVYESYGVLRIPFAKEILRVRTLLVPYSIRRTVPTTPTRQRSEGVNLSGRETEIQKVVHVHRIRLGTV